MNGCWAGVLAVGLTGCAVIPQQLPTRTAACPPAGTLVPFAKVMATNFVADYQGCSIATTAEFVGNGSGGMLLGGVENQYPIIRVVPPGEPHPSGLQAPFFVAVPKNNDLAFSLKSGQLVGLIGGTQYNADAPTLSVFIASSITRK